MEAQRQDKAKSVVNHLNFERESPLHWIACYGSRNSCEMLVSSEYLIYKYRKLE